MSIWLVTPLFMPFFSGITIGLFGRFLRRRVSYALSIFSLFVSLIYSISLLPEIDSLGILNIKIGDILSIFYDIKDSIRLPLEYGFSIDHNTIFMFSMVSIISIIVQFYSIGYMEDHSTRFITYLSLFTSCMHLVIAANTDWLLFIGWEAMGLFSYLLVGYWFDKDSANNAAYKVFITNRIGDIGFILGMILHYRSMVGLNSISLLGIEMNTNSLAYFMFLLPAMAKSAQILMHVWLPDAMQAPTPVSALLHAATMVAAGVILMIKVSITLHIEHSDVIVLIGAITAFFAASCAICQTDIKKVIAYSTCSQLGFMFVAIGVGHFGAASFHLITHAFFKSLLFLCAGAFIFLADHEQDILKMKGLARRAPFISILFLIGSFSLIGLFPFSGYYSKDMIVLTLYTRLMENFNIVLLISMLLLFLSVFMTSLYIFRLFFILIGNKGDYSHKKLHDLPKFFMSVPIAILGIMSIPIGKFFMNWFSSNCTFPSLDGAVTHNNCMEIMHSALPIILLLISISGILFAFIYRRYNILFSKFSKQSLQKFLYHGWYFDNMYNIILITPISKIADFLTYFDGYIFQNTFINISSSIKDVGKYISKIRSGILNQQIWIILYGAILLISLYLIMIIFG